MFSYAESYVMRYSYQKPMLQTLNAITCLAINWVVFKSTEAVQTTERSERSELHPPPDNSQLNN